MTGSLPPSAKFILQVLDERNAVAREEILDECAPIYAETTVDDALAELREADHVETMTDPVDTRRRLYSRATEDAEIDA